MYDECVAASRSKKPLLGAVITPLNFDTVSHSTRYCTMLSPPLSSGGENDTVRVESDVTRSCTLEGAPLVLKGFREDGTLAAAAP